MADTPPVGETVTPGTTQPTAATVTTPPADNGNAAEVERLRLEKEKADTRIRQLENEAAAKQKAEDDAKAKELEKNEEYKTLLDQERAKREKLEQEADDREAKAELNKAKAEALKDFPEEVQTQAEDLGIDLTRADEADIKAYVEKLTKLNDGFSSNGKVTSNNGRQSTAKYDEHEILQAHANGDKDAMNTALNRIPWVVDSMKEQG